MVFESTLVLSWEVIVGTGSDEIVESPLGALVYVTNR